MASTHMGFTARYARALVLQEHGLLLARTMSWPTTPTIEKYGMGALWARREQPFYSATALFSGIPIATRPTGIGLLLDGSCLDICQIYPGDGLALTSNDDRVHRLTRHFEHTDGNLSLGNHARYTLAELKGMYATAYSSPLPAALVSQHPVVYTHNEVTILAHNPYTFNVDAEHILAVVQDHGTWPENPAHGTAWTQIMQRQLFQTLGLAVPIMTYDRAGGVLAVSADITPNQSVVEEMLDDLALSGVSNTGIVTLRNTLQDTYDMTSRQHALLTDISSGVAEEALINARIDVGLDATMPAAQSDLRKFYPHIFGGQRER